MANEKAVFKFNADFGRQGDLTGLFIATKEQVETLIESGIEVYFGEVLGKHSEIYGSIEQKEISLVSDNPEVIKVIEDFDLTSGYNPFDYTIINPPRSEFEDMLIFEVVDILIKEKSEKK